MGRGILYGFVRDIQHYFVLRKKGKRWPGNTRKVFHAMHKRLDNNCLPVARIFGEINGRCEEAYELSLQKPFNIT